MKRYEHLEEAMCKELDNLNKKYSNGAPEMSAQDVEKIDVLYHALKSAATYYAMKEAEEWGDDSMEGSGKRYGMDRSYRRGRDATGRYISRDMDGYSGHYPEWMPQYYPRY